MKRLYAFKYAFTGIVSFFKKDINGQLELMAAIVAIAAGWFFHISGLQWVTVLLCTGSVLTLEMINTSIEKLCDMIQPEYHPQIKIIKDVAAGAVLLSAVVSLVIGIIIFYPHIILLF
ncbi:MAG: diacylglycerol kinase family protein [Agriterribacter sp.]